VCDAQTLHAVIANRYDVLQRYAGSLRRTYLEEVERLRRWSPQDAEALRPLKNYLTRLQRLSEAERVRLSEALKSSRALAVAVAMRDELAALWERSNASKEQLVRQLQDWCQRAEASGVGHLAEFSRRLRRYA
jgi:stearoyl-CoA desaturase (delta-9 desaturase)